MNASQQDPGRWKALPALGLLVALLLLGKVRRPLALTPQPAAARAD